ncbi:cytochrome P450 [Streptomyces sp. NPDC057717]|uniref:cytochrome P450 n=1 Tax=Streptomyces sp. NPDC057717 TaxID=3346224 RepID=UPI003693F444
MTQPAAFPARLNRDAFALAPQLPRIRAELPVARVRLPNGASVWLVTRHADIREVLSDVVRFGSDGRFLTDPNRGGAVAADPATSVCHGDITQYDPPDHGRLRRMIASGFTARRVQRLQPRIDEIVSGTLDAMEGTGSAVDLVQSFALPVPSLVICELLGVPYADRAEFQARTVVRFDSTRSPAVRAAAIEASLEYMSHQVARERKEPGDGLLGTLVREHGDELDDRELTGIGDLLLLGGHETTANTIALGSLLLLQNPEHIESLSDPDRLSAFVEELLRFVCVVQTGVPRVARQNTLLAGRSITRGERLLCYLPSGNRDEAFVGDPEFFDPTRKPGAHLAFGHGIHYCIGAPLARMEMRAALPALFGRFPTLRRHTPTEQLTFRASSAVYGVESLPVVW